MNNVEKLHGLAQLARNAKLHHERTGEWNDQNIFDLITGITNLAGRLALPMAQDRPL
jgi:hypothetical protein